jgi:hypothetical protein
MRGTLFAAVSAFVRQFGIVLGQSGLRFQRSFDCEERGLR